MSFLQWYGSVAMSTCLLKEVSALDVEFQAYIRKLKAEWLCNNRVESRDVYEVMRPEEQAEVHQRIDQWARYITPFAEEWWKRRGFGVVWPDDNSKQMKVFPLRVPKESDTLNEPCP